MDAETRDEGNEDGVMEYSEERSEWPFKFKKKDGSKKNYRLVEMMQDGVSTWMRFRATRAKMNRQGNPDANTLDTKNFQATLISMCCVDDDKGGQQVSIQEVATSFPASMLADLYKRCEKMNGLTEEAVDEQKKD